MYIYIYIYMHIYIYTYIACIYAIQWADSGLNGLDNVLLYKFIDSGMQNVGVLYEIITSQVLILE